MRAFISIGYGAIALKKKKSMIIIQSAKDSSIVYSHLQSDHKVIRPWRQPRETAEGKGWRIYFLGIGIWVWLANSFHRSLMLSSTVPGGWSYYNLKASERTYSKDGNEQRGQLRPDSGWIHASAKELYKVQGTLVSNCRCNWRHSIAKRMSTSVARTLHYNRNCKL